MWMLENLLELPGTAEESSFFEEECTAERLTLLPHQPALFNGGRGVRNVIGKSEKDVCIGRELGANVNATRSRG